MTFVGCAWRYAERAHSTALTAEMGISRSVGRWVGGSVGRWVGRSVGWGEQVLHANRISNTITCSHIQV